MIAANRIAGERGRMQRQLERIAIVNRGEAAMRLINAVRELRIETGADLRTIALHTDAERTAMFVRESDEAVCIDRDRAPDARESLSRSRGARRRPARGARRRSLGGLGLRRRTSGVRRALRSASA